MTTMRQIQLTEWGDESVLHEANVPIPTPVRGHVLIKTVAAGVNPIDVTTRKGLGPAAQLADPSYRPFVPGWDVAGTVVATAGDYTGFKVGDGVFGMVTFPYPGARTPSMSSHPPTSWPRFPPTFRAPSSAAHRLPGSPPTSRSSKWRD